MRGFKLTCSFITLVLIFGSVTFFSIYTAPNTAGQQLKYNNKQVGATEDILNNFTLHSNRSIEITNRTVIDQSVEISDSYLFFNLSGEYIIEKNGILKLNNSIMSLSYMVNRTPKIHVLSGGQLEFNYVTILPMFEWLNYTTINITIDPGASLKMTNCDVFLLDINNDNNASFKIRSDDVQIENCDFNILSYIFCFENVSDVNIENCNFPLSALLQIFNSSNITFHNCHFHENYIDYYAEENYSISLIDSGNNGPIKLVNCSLKEQVKSYPKYWDQKSVIRLERSNLSFYNVSTFFYINNASIKNIFESDNGSEIEVYWPLTLRTVNKKNESMGDVDITITDKYNNEVLTGQTDENGILNGLWLIQNQILGNNDLDYNPIKIKAAKNKDEYSGSMYLTLDEANSSKIIVVELEKSDSDEDSFEDNLMLFCICGMVIITTFLVLMSINVYLARKKVGIDKISGSRIGSTGQRTNMLGKDAITCSECGTQVTDDATFCPHCGEYFEGEEVFCPGCNSRINEAAETCPNCGRKFSSTKSSTKTTKNESVDTDKDSTERVAGKLYCSACGGVVRNDDKVCPGCGLKLESVTPTEKPALFGVVTSNNKDIAYRLTAKEEAKIDKERSRSKKSKEYQYKITKKDQGKPQKKDVEDTYMCSICGADVTGSAKKCPSCGTELE